MIELSASQIAEALGATEHRPATDSAQDPPSRAVIDSREAGAGDLFFGIAGENVDGGKYASDVIERGAWGLVITAANADLPAGSSHVFVVDDPTAALGDLAHRWRHELGAKVIGVTGSTGKTTTKDILAALLGKSLSVVATPANFNTEIGLPLTVLSASRGTDALVLEMAMRGPDQIDLLARIAEPDVGCIVNVGPVHLEQLGSLEAVAAAKAELIAGLGPDAVAVIPADEPLLTPHLRSELKTVSFGPGGDVRLLDEDAADELTIATPEGEVKISPSFKERYLTRNLLAAVACAQAVGAPVEGDLNVSFSALRGEISEVLGGVTLINDCYNANPVSMRAALDNLADAGGRHIAVLGGMGELGADSTRFHHEVARHAADSGVDFLISVGELGGAYGDDYVGSIEHVVSPEAAAYVVRRVAEPGDTVLVKGSRSVGLEKVGEILVNASRQPGEVSG
jgi:UDP-N-acetylmuramoyl-tripeptide--D-alanyl-D-alanine ligase